jgi:hypothetical protein
MRPMTLRVLVAFSLLLAASSVRCEPPIPAGTWIKRDTKSPITMTVEPVGTGARLTYRFKNPDPKKANILTMIVESKFDGSESQVLIDGKPSGETMEIKRVGANHTETVVKVNGKPMGNSKSELSADGRTITVENEVQDAPDRKRLVTEHWDKQ